MSDDMHESVLTFYSLTQFYEIQSLKLFMSIMIGDVLMKWYLDVFYVYTRRS